MGKQEKVKKSADVKVAILIAERFISEKSFYAKIYKKMILELADAGCEGIAEIIDRKSEEEGILPAIISDHEAQQCVMIGEMRSSYIEKVLASRIKLIFFDFINEEFDVDSITGDNINGAYTLTRHLAEKGYRKIAFVGSYKATPSILDRLMGYLKYHMAKDMEINNRWILPDRDKNGYLIDQHLPVEMPEAFVCCCDETAYRLIENLQKYGYKVPENIAVTGYDDYAEHVIEGIRLTTWHVNIYEMIKACIGIIKKRISDPGYRYGNITVNGSLIERNST